MSYEEHKKKLIKYAVLVGTGRYHYLSSYVYLLVRDAYIAGAAKKPTGLNVPAEERADEYCKEQGLLP